MIKRQLTTSYRLWLLGLSLFLGACQLKESPQPDSVPANLLVNAIPDSIITLTEQVDFSTISETGQGPTGTLIRWQNENRSNRIIQANTYDAQSRLVGVFSPDYSFGYQRLATYRYQADLVAESYDGFRFNLTQPLSGIQPGSITKCQYNSDKQLARLLTYRRISETDTFKLISITNYEYGSTGQLQLTRFTSRESPNSLVPINHWQNGDFAKSEVYYPAKEYLPFPTTHIEEYTYNQQPNPYAQIGNPFNQTSAHNFIRRTSYNTTINPFSTSPYDYDEVQYDNDQQYDTQGHLVRQRMRTLLHNPDRWTEWGDPIRFTYAP